MYKYGNFMQKSQRFICKLQHDNIWFIHIRNSLKQDIYSFIMSITFFFKVTCFMRDCDVGQNNPEDWINENKNVNHESHFQISVITIILKYICLLDWFDTVLLLETYQLIVVDKELIFNSYSCHSIGVRCLI